MGNCGLCKHRINKSYADPSQSQDMSQAEYKVLQRYNYMGSEEQRNYFYNSKYNNPDSKKRTTIIQPLALNLQCGDAEVHGQHCDTGRTSNGRNDT